MNIGVIGCKVYKRSEKGGSIERSMTCANIGECPRIELDDKKNENDFLNRHTLYKGRIQNSFYTRGSRAGE